MFAVVAVTDSSYCCLIGCRLWTKFTKITSITLRVFTSTWPGVSKTHPKVSVSCCSDSPCMPSHCTELTPITPYPTVHHSVLTWEDLFPSPQPGIAQWCPAPDCRELPGRSHTVSFAALSTACVYMWKRAGGVVTSRSTMCASQFSRTVESNSTCQTSSTLRVCIWLIF